MVPESTQEMGLAQLESEELFHFFCHYLKIFLKFRCAFGVFYFKKSSNIAKILKKSSLKLYLTHYSIAFPKLETLFRTETFGITQIHHEMYVPLKPDEN